MDTASTVILNKLISACRAGAMSPSNTDLVKELRRWRIKRTQQEVGAIINGLEAAGRVKVHAPRYAGHRWFEIPGTGLATASRNKVLDAARPDKPPQPKPLNSYDANLKLGPPIRIVGKPDSERHMPKVSSPGQHRFSLVGCSAEMAALR